MVRSGDHCRAQLEAAASSEVIKVMVKTPRQKEEFLVPKDRPIKEFKASISARFSSPTDRLVLIFAGRILKDHKTLSQHGIHDDAVIYLVIQSRRRHQEHLGQHPGFPEGAATTKGKDSHLSRADCAGSTTFRTDSLQELVIRLGLNTTNFSEFQSQLTSNPEMMIQLLENPFIQSRLSNPDLMSELIMDNPLKQQLIEKSPEIGHFLSAPDMLRIMLEIARNPATVREIMKDSSQALTSLASILGRGSTFQDLCGDHPDLMLMPVQTQAGENSFASLRSSTSLTSSQTLLSTRRSSPQACTPPYSSPSNASSSSSSGSISDCTAQNHTRANPEPGRTANAAITTAIKSLLQQIIRQLVQNILAAASARGVQPSLSQNLNPGAMTLLLSPLTVGKLPMQPLPNFHQQIWHAEGLTAVPAPRETQVLAQIQRRLQALAMGEPGVPQLFLSPVAGLGHAAGLTGRAPSSSGLAAAETPGSTGPSQQFTVQQMLQALAAANLQQAQNL